MKSKRSSIQLNPISIINHELKSQLFGIKAYAQLLEKNIQKLNNAKLLGYAQRVDMQVDKLSYALSDFIDYIKISEKIYSLNQEFVSIDEVVTQTIKIFTSLFPEIRIKMQGKTSREVFADRNKLDKVLYALLTNAVTYSTNTPKITIMLFQSAKGVEVTVEDNGIGIAKEYESKIFNPFFSIPLEGYKERSGLGLFIAKKIIEMHGGKLKVESQPKRGSTFTCFLPF
ncbi:MAG: HAMP domain-containing histidine kinase [Patescibacteria group bacterium]|nr:HAMP domain-containing histidine kinase [Patescibacteria group bacterium]